MSNPPIEVLAKIAKESPLCAGAKDDSRYCFFCGAHEPYPLPNPFEEHKPDCAWVAARKLVGLPPIPER